MKFLVVGPGAMGCLFSCLLSRAGYKVEVLDYKAERAKRLSETGFRLEGISGDYQVKLPVSVNMPSVEPDITILCVKAYKTLEASRHLKGILKGNSVILTLQNGVGNLEILEETFGPDMVTAGVTSEGATLLGEGHVRHAGKGETVIGKGRIERPIIEKLVGAFNQAGIETRWQEDVTGLIWGKLIVNVGINALTAILRVRNGLLYENEVTRDLIRLVVEEAMEVIRRKNIKLPYEDPVEKVYQVAKNTAQNISSMLQDVLKGKDTEIQFMNGAIVREGKALGIRTPYNETLSRLISAMEQLRDERL